MTNKILNQHHSCLLRVAYVVTVALLAILPFSAFFSVWIGSSFHIYRFAELFKDAAILVVLAATVLSVPYDSLRNYVKQNKLLLSLIAAYVVLTLGYGLIAYRAGAVNDRALAFSVVNNLQFLAFFVTTHLLFSVHKSSFPWFMVLIFSAIPVIVFGLLQEFLLAPRFLEHFGYSMFTILPFQYVDNQPDFLRTQSFLRGANPLGAYLVIVLTALLYKVGVVRNLKSRIAIGFVAILGFIVLFYTYSRSAWLGLLVGGILLCLLRLDVRSVFRPNKKWLIVLGLGIIFIVAIAGSSILKNQTIDKALLHSDSKSAYAETSNGVRASRIKEGIRTVQAHPLGIGPGTAGPASVHNAPHPSFIPENYFLQIAIEVGVQGLLIFLAINGLVGYYLWQSRGSGLALVLLVSLVGLSVINMFSHAWTDDTLSLLWWGLAGLALASTRKVFVRREDPDTTSLLD